MRFLAKEVTSKAEIGDPDVSVLIQQNVCWLYTAIQHPVNSYRNRSSRMKSFSNDNDCMRCFSNSRSNSNSNTGSCSSSNAITLTFHQTHYRSYRGRVFTGQMTQRSNDPTNSVKALKEDRVLRIRLQSHQIHPAMLTIIQQLCSMQSREL